MNVAVLHTPQWSISTRRRGEILTASASADGIDLAVLAAPDGFSASEIEGWLRDLIGVAHETSRGDAQPRAIPTLLHHALTGLLFSHAELWERSGVGSPCSVALASGLDEVGFGWVGEANVQLWLNDLPLEGGWIRVRDASGREAQAISLDARSRIRIRLEWSHGEGVEPGAVLEAEWPFVSDEADSPPETQANGTSAMVGSPGVAVTAEIAPESGAAAGAASIAVESGALSAPPAVFAAERDSNLAEEPGARARRPRRRGRLAAAMSQIRSLWSRRPQAADVDATPLAMPETASSATAVPEPVASEPEFAVASISEAPMSEAATHRTLVPRAMAPVEPMPLTEPSASRSSPIPGFGGWDPHLRELASETSTASAAPPVLRLPPPPASSEFVDAARVSPAPPPLLEVRETSSSLISDTDTPSLPGLARTPGAEPSPASIEEWITRELAAQKPPTHAPVIPPPVAEVSPPAVAPIVSPALVAPPVVVPEPSAPLADTHVAAAASDSERDAVMASAVPGQQALSGASLARTPHRPQWPSASELEAGTPLWKRPWTWIALVVALFAGGWLLGAMQGDRTEAVGPRGMGRVLRFIGLGGARFDMQVRSSPEGAWIAVDGKDLARRTPASLDLAAGIHVVTLSFSDRGESSYRVTGERGQQLSLDAPLWGSLIVRETDSGLPVTVSFDGRALGYAPVTVDSVMPGAHELRFSGPGMVPWGQTVEVRVRQQAEVLAHPMTSPASGVIEVRATLVDQQGEQTLSGGEVWIDGELRGRTPLTIDLPRGPHSARVVYRGESSPVQVIDLPGGNQRFASFVLGTGVDRPRLVASGIPERMPADRPAVASASLDGVAVTDVREMWLHVRTPDGSWRRYQMEILKSAFGAVGVAVYPATLFDEQGSSRHYMSALTGSGDEYFTEIATIRLEAARKPSAAR